MNNKKLIRNIIISVLVIAALVGILVWVNSIPDKTADSGSETETLEQSDSIEIFKVDKENVKSVSVENEKGSYTILKNGDEYTVADNKGIEYSSVNLGFNFESFLQINGSKDVTEDDIPFTKTAEAVITMNDGVKHVLTLGGEVIGETKTLLKYNDKVYAVPTYNISCFNQELNSFRSTQLGKLEANLESMEIYENSKELVAIRKATEEDNKKFRVNMSYVMTYPKFLGVSSDRLQSFMELIQNGYSLDIISFADDNKANFSKYGIGKKTLIIDDGKNEYKFAFGNKDDKGNVYTVLNNGSSVYTMSSALFDIIDKYNGDVLMDKLTHIADLNNVKTLVFEGKGDKYTLERKGNEDNYKYDINGNDIAEDKFKDAYQEIIGITSDKIAYNNVSGSAEYTVTINYLDGKTEIWEYVPYDERNYVLKKDGQESYICLKKKPAAAMQNIKNILSNN